MPLERHSDELIAFLRQCELRESLRLIGIRRRSLSEGEIRDQITKGRKDALLQLHVNCPPLQAQAPTSSSNECGHGTEASASPAKSSDTVNGKVEPSDVGVNRRTALGSDTNSTGSEHFPHLLEENFPACDAPCNSSTQPTSTTDQPTVQGLDLATLADESLAVGLADRINQVTTANSREAGGGESASCSSSQPTRRTSTTQLEPVQVGDATVVDHPPSQFYTDDAADGEYEDSQDNDNQDGDDDGDNNNEGLVGQMENAANINDLHPVVAVAGDIPVVAEDVDAYNDVPNEDPEVAVAAAAQPPAAVFDNGAFVIYDSPNYFTRLSSFVGYPEDGWPRPLQLARIGFIQTTIGIVECLRCLHRIPVTEALRIDALRAALLGMVIVQDGLVNQLTDVGITPRPDVPDVLSCRHFPQRQ